MRNASIAVLREIGVDTGGSNVQFAVNPDDGRLVVIEMNPRVSRSSALASKATGFPIAKVAAKLAVGYTLDELTNDITRVTPASFEPTIDYVVTKMPRFTFEKFPGAEPLLTTSMKSVGEAMAIGRTFPESLQKALRSMETGLTGFDEVEIAGAANDRRSLRAALARPTPDRLLVVAAGLRHGLTVEEIHGASASSIRGSCARSRGSSRPKREVARKRPAARHAGLLRLKGMGFSDARLAELARHRRQEVAAAPQARRRARSTSASTPAPPSSPRHALHVFDLRGRRRMTPAECEAEPTRPAQGDHPRRRAEPHRPGHRVRLLLRPRRLRAARGRHRDHHGQLQSGDGVDRLRHLRPALFRAADRRGRDRAGAGRAAQAARCSASSCSSAARRR